MDKIVAIILAAGKGTRMRSKLPKVLHRVAGKPMVAHVIEAAYQAGVADVVLVVGHQSRLIEDQLGQRYRFAYQEPQLGTGHAVIQAQDHISTDARLILVLCGDTPLLTGATLEKLIAEHRRTGAVATVLSAVLPDPTGYGRIVRNQAGQVERIVEEKDATTDERQVQEINTGTYCFDKDQLFQALQKIDANNAQGEYYLTDVIAVLRRQGQHVAALVADHEEETRGINNRAQLAQAEKVIRSRINLDLMEKGVTIIDPDSTYIDAGVEIGVDTVIYPFTFILGQTRIGEDCQIGPDCSITDSVIASGSTVTRSVLWETQVGEECRIGPFAYLRPGTVLMENVKIGDFVEVKNSTIGPHSKVPHLTYIGDTFMGQKVNVGAGTITCNYDGENKWPTIIEDEAFIGSNTNLVAPVKVGPRAVIGAGSTITHDVPGDALGIARARQVNLTEWVKKKKR